MVGLKWGNECEELVQVGTTSSCCDDTGVKIAQYSTGKRVLDLLSLVSLISVSRVLRAIIGLGLVLRRLRGDLSGGVADDWLGFSGPMVLQKAADTLPLPRI